jgi:hypothetical protein
MATRVGFEEATGALASGERAAIFAVTFFQKNIFALE